jgi:hypothetical protein
MRRLPGRSPSPALVISCIALFLSMGGVSYGLATGVIDTREIRNGTIVSKDVRFRGLLGTDIRQDEVGGNAVKESTLGQVPNAATAEGVTRQAVVSPSGTAVRVRNVLLTARFGEGQYDVVFDRDVTGCVYVATIGDEGTGGPGTGQIAVGSTPGNPGGVRVRTRSSDGTAQDRSFHLIVSC